MAEGQVAETPVSEITAFPQHVGRLSDRAIQRLVGGNAFLRGRIYARRNAVSDLHADATSASCRVLIRSDEPIEVSATLNDEAVVVSKCTCQAWRGPTGHCKHVAALLVALRDRERPPKPKPPEGSAANNSTNHNARLAAADDGDLGDGGLGSEAPSSLGGSTSSAVTGVVSAVSGSLGAGGAGAQGAGKRRRSRRRRRGASPVAAPAGAPTIVEVPVLAPPSGPKLEVLSARQLGIGAARRVTATRDGLDAWLPPGEVGKPCSFEYRLTVRAASITVTPVLAGTRSAVPIAEALSSFNSVIASERPLLRALSRHAPRSTPATAELRGEDAAEVLGMLRGRRVLLEPASKELRFADGELVPKIELDLASAKALRIRVVFEQGSRRFPLSSGAWFEGTPGWHVDTTDGVARPVVDTVTPAWLQRLYRSPALVHPLPDLPRLLTEYIPKVAASLGTELPDLTSVADVIDAPPHFQLRVLGDIVEARVKLRVDYQGNEYDVPPTGFPSPLAFLTPERGATRPKVVRRDIGAEMASVQEILNLGGFSVDETGEFLVARTDDAVRFWTEGIGSLPETWDRFIPNDLVDVTIHDAAVAPQARVSSGIDWLSLDLTFQVNGIAVDEEELRQCLASGRRLVRLADGTFAPVKSDEVREILERMAEIYASTGTRDRKLALSQAGRVQDLLSLVKKTSVSPEAKQLFAKLADVTEIDSVPKPRSLKANLRPYQKDGFSWLVFLHELATGGILADDMGLGKTVQAIALMLWLKNKFKDQKLTHLVIAPTSVVPNWLLEIEKFGPSLNAMVWHGPDRHALSEQLSEFDVVITSYALMRRDEELLTKFKFHSVILDEAQHIKNPMSATARAVKKLKSERRMALTGTPIENRLSEIWSIFDFVSPGLLGDLARFEEKFARPIDRGDQEAAAKLRAAIHRFVLRRTKSEVAKDLPPKIEQDIIVPLADEQNKLYKQILRQVRESVLSEVEKQGVAKSQIQILAALTRLRQVACDPRLMKLEGPWNEELSGKLSALKEIMQEAVAGGHRVLIFSQFVEMLKLIRNVLEAEGITHEWLTGDTKDRMARVDHFNNDDSVSAFLISLKAGGTGLNLTGADTVIHFDPWWNPAVEDQATDRAHRIGQKRTVSVYRLIAKDSVEEKILQLSEKKRELMTNVLNTEAPMKGLTKQDVDDLFS
ncbi:MAG TPA: SNF2-related protein [Polyangiales bacterium]|nr:SNF2-related protein [Polyangiales bacterium]